ncbi:hypothetical protein [Mesorhizobium sp. 1M-11]|uniref:hypothetical protein n=1 Tax=Mesorhizobium sp. 1M-11 TaxID=1529006 RepID=UPI001FCE21B8|nr:hypothetical protein [Mesorhizobium sp. 1M-11]
MVPFFEHEPRNPELAISMEFCDGDYAATRRIWKFLDKQIVAAIALENKRVSVKTFAIIRKNRERRTVDPPGFGDSRSIDQPIGDLPIERTPSLPEFLYGAIDQAFAEIWPGVPNKTAILQRGLRAIGNRLELAPEKTGDALHNQRYSAGKQIVAGPRKPEPVPEHGASPCHNNAIEASGKFRQLPACQHCVDAGKKSALTAKLQLQDRCRLSRCTAGEIDDEIGRAAINRRKRRDASRQRGTKAPAFDRQNSIECASTRCRCRCATV